MNKPKTVYFVSVIRALDTQVTSTYIMTSSLLNGIKENGHKVVFFAICEHRDELNKIKEYYTDKGIKVIPLPSAIGHDAGTIKNLKHILVHTINISFYEVVIKNALGDLQNVIPDLLISHAPSFEAICYARGIRKHYNDLLYYEYWSDPMALSGITPEQLNIKRIPFKWAEQKALANADRIIYGTKTLMQFQQELYPRLADRMSYIDIPYVEKSYSTEGQVIENSLLYAGNYHSNLRNIRPLVEAVSQLANYTLDIYGDGDCSDTGSNNIFFHGRISPEELNKLENRYSCTICILNHSCIQIPGKIFYDTVKPVKTLVILDGPYNNRIGDYLASYNRFVFCNNTADEIKIAIQKLNGFEFDLGQVRKNYSPIKIAEDLLTGGEEG